MNSAGSPRLASGLCLESRLARGTASRRRGSMFSFTGWGAEPAFANKVFDFIPAFFNCLSRRLAVHCLCRRVVFASFWTAVTGPATQFSPDCCLGWSAAALGLSPEGPDLKRDAWERYLIGHSASGSPPGDLTAATPGVLLDLADQPSCDNTFDRFRRLFRQALLLRGFLARLLSARESCPETSGPCSISSAGSLARAGEGHACGPHWRTVASGQLLLLAMASSCGDNRWRRIRGCSRSSPCGAHSRESLTVWRRLGAASGERSRAHEGTLALEMAATLSLNVACIFGLL